MENVVLQPRALSRLASSSQTQGRIGVIAAWLSYCVVVSVAVLRHEPWADEAQAWLMARDLPLIQMIVSEMRYEGTPSLWHLLLWVMTRLGLPYESMSWVSAALAMAGAAYLLFKAPFPRPMRYAIAASFWILYQYAVIARQYVLVPLLTFVAADLFARAREKTYRFTVVLVLLALTSVHGAVMAVAFASAYAVHVIRDWKLLDGQTLRRQIYAGMMFSGTLLLIAVQLFPPKDLFDPPAETGIAQVFEGINGALLDWMPASLLVAVLLGTWAWRRGSIVLYVLGVASMTCLYGLIHGWPHHLGLTFVVIVAVLWHSWPTKEEIVRFTRPERMHFRATVIAVWVVLGVQIFYSGVALYNEYRTPYSGAKEAATYLRGIIASNKRVYGFDYGMNAVLAYFDRNILANQASLNGGVSFYHHSSNQPIADEQSFMRFRQTRPEYLLVICWYPPQAPQNRQLASSNGYVLERAFPGRLISKSSFGVYQTYLLFRRGDLPGIQAAGPRESGADEPCKW